MYPLRPFTAFCIATLLAGCDGKTAATGNGKPAGMPPVPVNIALAARKDMPLDLGTFGNVEPIANIAVKAQVGGELIEVSFEEGQEVKKGALLFTIQPKLYATQLAQAEANLARDRAQAANAKRNLVRQEALDAKGAGVKEELDKARAAAEAGDATVKADDALLLIAQTQLGYTTIESPIDGRTGAVRLRPGNLIKPNDDLPLTTVVQLAPIYVTFALPEQHLAAIRKGTAAGTLAVKALDPNDGRVLGEGTLTFIANTVDTTTGTITLKGTFPNASHALWPGAFVDVSLRLDTERGAVVVPSSAVTTSQRGPQVFVVKDDGTAESRPVTVARTVGQESLIKAGVEPGDKVITNGQSRLLPGSKVIPKPAAEAAPAGDATPAGKPAASNPTPSAQPASETSRWKKLIG